MLQSFAASFCFGDGTVCPRGHTPPEDSHLKFQKKPKKKTALVFVDFEYMQISHKNRWGIEPPLHDWYDALCAEYDVKELYVFADFSNSAMKNNLPVLRQITDNIIETQNTASRHKKDFTDFFLLDKIYQKAFEKNKAQTYILFTGDGHFGAVSRFLIRNCKKEVVIYGVEGNISGGLYSQVTRIVEYPDTETIKKQYVPMLARLYMTMQKGNRQKASVELNAVAAAAEKQLKLNRALAREVLDDMTAKGYLKYEEQWVSALKRTRILVCDTEKLRANGFDMAEKKPE